MNGSRTQSSPASEYAVDELKKRGDEAPAKNVWVRSLTSIRTHVRQTLTALLPALLLVAGGNLASAVDIAPPYDSNYSLLNLGTPTGVPGSLGGLTVKAGDPNKLLIGGNANGGGGSIWEIGLTRDLDGHITGFSGSATKFADAPNIDGGLAYGPGGVLFYTTYSSNTIGQIKPGSTGPDKIIPLPTSSSVGSLAFAPDGSLKIAQYNNPGNFYSTTITPDGNGTFDIAEPTLTATFGATGPEGVAYVPSGSPNFAVNSMLLSDYSGGKVWAVEVDASWNPIYSTKKDFVTGLSGAEGAFIDPISGDFIFSTFGGGNQVVVVRGFVPVPEPSTYALAAIASGVMAVVARRKSRKS